ncbi:MAG TPA: substrate-binding domain-containing protein [Solirubrobacteraceae bacterium]|nr:substrate-binding domain-containing protein [Solirubrobacteraceae bacterium]
MSRRIALRPPGSTPPALRRPCAVVPVDGVGVQLAAPPRSSRPLRAWPSRSSRRRPRWPLLAVVAICATLAAGCGSSSRSSSGPSSASAARGHGPVDVLYAGSLEQLMDARVGPAFQKAAGYTFSGFPGGSDELAAEIRGKVRQGDVFLSASPKVNAKLMGASGGHWVSWFAPFASTRLVLGYNPSSRFASALRSRPWYDVVAAPGFRLGLTDPKLDPKGVLAVAALDRAAAAEHRPALRRIAADHADYFPEEDLVGRLQSGQLDAGFFYTVEASAVKLHTVGLGSIDERAEYTITVLDRAPHPAAARAFVKFLLSPRGLSALRSAGLDAHSPARAVGSGVPAALASVIRR